jgi:hypothetical protein
MSSQSIASRKLLAVDQSGHEFEVTIAIGLPYEISAIEWACPVSIDGLERHLSGAHGIESWQAMQLAYQLIARLLGYFIQDGGQLLWIEERQPVLLEELFPAVAPLD